MTKKSSGATTEDKKTNTKQDSTKTASDPKTAKKRVTHKKEKKDNKAEEAQKDAAQAEVSTEEKKGDKKKEETADAEAKAKEWQDKYMRLSAEFDNYRKRTLKEKTELIKSANEDLLVDILRVVDDFERGIATIDKSEDLKALKDGIHLIYNKFSDFLKQKGIKEIDAKEKEFDLDYHEAMTKIPAPDEELKGKVVDVIEKGYMLHDKVIRYAKVVVGE